MVRLRRLFGPTGRGDRAAGTDGSKLRHRRLFPGRAAGRLSRQPVGEPAGQVRLHPHHWWHRSVSSLHAAAPDVSRAVPLRPPGSHQSAALVVWPAGKPRLRAPHKRIEVHTPWRITSESKVRTVRISSSAYHLPTPNTQNYAPNYHVNSMIYEKRTKSGSQQLGRERA